MKKEGKKKNIWSNKDSQLQWNNKRKEKNKKL